MLARVCSNLEIWFGGPAAPPKPALPLRTARLVLRSVIKRDLPQLWEYHRDPRVLQYLQRTDPYTEAEVHDIIIGARENLRQSRPVYYFLGIVLASEERLIGDVSLWLPTASEFPHAAATALLGFAVHPDYWGSGYATEAAQALVRFAFCSLNRRSVYAGCHPENGASRRVLEKSGLQYIGRWAEFPASAPATDSLVFRITRDEWFTRHSEAPHTPE